MPIHDWSCVESGTFHDFHQGWTIEIRNALNRGILPPGYFAMADQRIGGPEPDGENASWISDADLDMGFFTDPAPMIETQWNQLFFGLGL